MVEKGRVNLMKRTPERCPDCDGEVTIRFDRGTHQMTLYNLNDSLHQCNGAGVRFERHQIGATVIGKTVTDYQLRGRVLTITLDDGNILSVSAVGKPLNIGLAGPAGMMQE